MSSAREIDLTKEIIFASRESNNLPVNPYICKDD